MTAEEIRGIQRSTETIHTREGTVMAQRGVGAANLLVLSEIAAQLAEANEIARLRLHLEYSQCESPLSSALEEAIQKL